MSNYPTKRKYVKPEDDGEADPGKLRPCINGPQNGGLCPETIVSRWPGPCPKCKNNPDREFVTNNSQAKRDNSTARSKRYRERKKAMDPAK